jgi:surface polysaccharide O-acyltransferase-like enzyme
MKVFGFFMIHGSLKDFKMSMNEDVFYCIGLGFLVASVLLYLTFPKESAEKEKSD